MKRCSLILLILTFFYFPLYGEVPSYINLQGFLRSQAGSPVQGNFTMVFSFYTTDTGGDAIWSKQINNVLVEKGLFSVSLGPLSNEFDNNPTLWLEVKIGQDNPLPRKQIQSVAYAFKAKNADLSKTSQGLQCSGCVGDSQINFNYAKGTAKGGDAAGLQCSKCVDGNETNFPWAEGDANRVALKSKDLECSGCVEAGDIGPDAINSLNIQDGAISSADVNFKYALGISKEGAAVDLQCSGCVSSSDIAPNISLTGDLSVGGSLNTCTDNLPQCNITLSSDGGFYEKNDGWINLQIKNGMRIRNQNDSEWRDLVGRNITSYGNFNLYGNFLCTDCIGAAEVAGGFYSGLDADLLDGKDSTFFAPTSELLKIFSNTADVSNGSYLEVKHNGNTNDIMVIGWLFDGGIWKIVHFESSITEYVAEEDLVGYWNFNDCSANDSSQQKNHGKLIGNPSCVDGKVEKAIDLNGSQRIEINDHPSLNPPYISIVLWTYRKGFSGADNDILLNKEISPGYEIAVADVCYTHSGNFSYWFSDSPGGGCGGWNNGGFSVPQNTWVHIAITNDNNYCKTYKDGNLILTHNCPGSIGASPYCLLIGARGGCGNQAAPYVGIVDEVAIYKRALSAEEIQTIYNSGVQKKQQSLYRIEQNDANSVRLYNDSGSVKKLKLIVIRK